VSSTIAASMVLYHNHPDCFGPAVRSFLDSDPRARIAIVDNSSRSLQHDLFQHDRVTYIFPGRNLGFGAGHNLAFENLSSADFHLLLNPDVNFSPAVVRELLSFAASDAGIGAVMPKICFPNGSLQGLCKLLPTPFDLMLRRFIPVRFLQEMHRRRYELHDLPQDRVIEVPSLSSCFLLLRSALFRELGGFDERYFMYMEDVDLIRRIGDRARTVYYPFVTVEHEYAKGSYKDRRLLRYHLQSAVKYFSKWGWYFDAARARRNAEALGALVTVPVHGHHSHAGRHIHNTD
jgi:GT2 family glycosyltransferase